MLVPINNFGNCLMKKFKFLCLVSNNAYCKRKESNILVLFIGKYTFNSYSEVDYVVEHLKFINKHKHF